MNDYDFGVLTWSEHQAELLRRIAVGELVNETLDWWNIAVEIEDVGRSELRSLELLLTQALLQTLKAGAWPTCRVARGGPAVPPPGRPTVPAVDAPANRAHRPLRRCARGSAREHGWPTTAAGSGSVPHHAG